MNVLVTGGAGFIGSNLVDRLLAEGHEVTVFDNFSTGKRAFLKAAEASNNFTLVHGDLLEQDSVNEAVVGQEAVIHLSANADVRFGWEHPRVDFEQNLQGTHNLLEAMRESGVTRLVFSSTGSVYGEARQIPTPENSSFPVQTSLYGASKFAAEGLIAAYAEAGFLTATILRFVSILGPRYTHGHVFDFVRQLLQHPEYLDVLGDGSQRKSYLHVTDCVEAIVQRVPASAKLEIFNLGSDEFCTVSESIGWIVGRMECAPEIRFSGGDRGWIGDNPFIYLDTALIQETGWTAQYRIEEAINSTVDWLLLNRWLFL